MNEKQRRITELLFITFVLNLFNKSHNPVITFGWLKHTCEMLRIEPDPMQRITLYIMSKNYDILKVSDELGYLLMEAGLPAAGIIKAGIRKKDTLYRRIKRYRTQGYIPTPLCLSVSDTEYCLKFLQLFTEIGGLL